MIIIAINHFVIILNFLNRFNKALTEIFQFCRALHPSSAPCLCKIINKLFPFLSKVNEKLNFSFYQNLLYRFLSSNLSLNPLKQGFFTFLRSAERICNIFMKHWHHLKSALIIMIRENRLLMVLMKWSFGVPQTTGLETLS